MIDREAEGGIDRMEALFGYGPTIDGFEVIALDTGRPVSEPYETRQQANGRAQHLNAVAKNGTAALARALRAG